MELSKFNLSHTPCWWALRSATSYSCHRIGCKDYCSDIYYGTPSNYITALMSCIII